MGYPPQKASQRGLMAHCGAWGGRGLAMPLGTLSFCCCMETMPSKDEVMFTTLSQPALCRDHLQSDTGHMVAEAKVDGVRCIVHVGATVEAFTRNGNPIALTFDAEQAVRSLGHELVDCELVGDTLHVFDLPAFGGSWRTRRAVLEHAVRRLGDCPALVIVPVLHDPAANDGYPEDTRAILAKATAAGHEGVVLKDPDAEYPAGRRDWAKVKPEATADLRVVDVLANGSLVVSRKGVRVIVGIGLPKAIRAAAPSMLGRLIEVRYQEVTKDGSLRHPVFLRVRDDKNEAN